MTGEVYYLWFITLSQIGLWSLIGILYYKSRKAQKEVENEDSAFTEFTETVAKLPEAVEKSFENFTEAINDSFDAVNNSFEAFTTQLNSLVDLENENNPIAQIVMASFFTAIESEEFKDYMKSLVLDAFNELQEKTEAALGIPTYNEEDLKKTTEHAKLVAGDVVLANLEQAIPPIARILLDRWSEGQEKHWTEQVRENPTMALQVINYLKAWGVLDMFSSLGGNSKPIAAKRGSGF